MNFYQEINLSLDLEAGLYIIWQKVFQQIHLALAENKIAENVSAVGISFPEYDAEKYTFGRKIRLFSQDESSLKKIACEKWLNRLLDYVQISAIKPVPEKLEGYAVFSRARIKGSKENLARRRAKRKGVSFEEAMKHYEAFERKFTKLPYINMSSLTTKNDFRLYVEKKIVNRLSVGVYSCYGLSVENSVPLF